MKIIKSLFVFAAFTASFPVVAADRFTAMGPNINAQIQMDMGLHNAGGGVGNNGGAGYGGGFYSGPVSRDIGLGNEIGAMMPYRQNDVSSFTRSQKNFGCNRACKNNLGKRIKDGYSLN